MSCTESIFVAIIVMTLLCARGIVEMSFYVMSEITSSGGLSIDARATVLWIFAFSLSSTVALQGHLERSSFVADYTIA